MKALFLDRDGTLIRHIPYLSDPNQVELMPGTQEVLQKALSEKYLLFLFTNQSGVGRGFYTLDSVTACNNRMLELLNLPSTIFTEICIATEEPGGAIIYRKPSPRFILEMVAKYKLRKDHSYMIGDSIRDVEAGRRAGIQSIAILNKQLAGLESIPDYIIQYNSILDWFKQTHLEVN